MNKGRDFLIGPCILLGLFVIFTLYTLFSPPPSVKDIKEAQRDEKIRNFEDNQYIQGERFKQRQEENERNYINSLK